MGNNRRLLEWGKDALIVALSLSAVYLLSMTPLLQDSGVLELLSPKESPAPGAFTATQGGAMLPARLVISAEGGRCGVQYDKTQLEELFSPLGALLGDALASAGEARPMTEAQWRQYLTGTGIYFDFAGDVPLSALEHWLQGPGTAGLDGAARRVLLCAGQGDQVLLCWQDADTGQFFFCPTALTQALHLNPATAAVTSNSAYFAFENPDLSQLLSPYTLVTEVAQQGVCYAVSNPLPGGGTSAVLDALAFNGQNHAPVSGGEVYLDGGDRLVVSTNGTVTYRAAWVERYPAGSTLADAVDKARALAEGTLGALCGEARLYLVSARESQGTLCLRFGYLLGGCPVYLGGEGWAAEFWVTDGYITQFTLHFRSYAPNGEHTLLLPIDKAAAMLPSISQERRELIIQYRDGGGPSVSPQWAAA